MLHDKKKKVRAPPLVASDCRRSDKIKHKLKGFGSSQCQDNNCFACSSAPPTLRPRIIKNQGKTFCKVPAKDLSNNILNTKKKTKSAIGTSKKDQGNRAKDQKKKKKKTKGAKEDSNEDKPWKKKK